MEILPAGISLPVTLAVLGGAMLHAGWNTMLKSSVLPVAEPSCEMTLLPAVLKTIEFPLMT